MVCDVLDLHEMMETMKMEQKRLSCQIMKDREKVRHGARGTTSSCLSRVFDLLARSPDLVEFVVCHRSQRSSSHTPCAAASTSRGLTSGTDPSPTRPPRGQGM